jgi:hypothetical protein
MAKLTKSQIEAQLEAKGIEFDGRLSAENLIKEYGDILDGEDVATEADEKERKVLVRLLTAFWPEESQRVEKGTITEVTVDEAFEGIEAGRFERVK